MYLVYIDDSRDEPLCVFSALAIPEDTWKESLNRLRDFRRRMKREYGILVYKEFHAWKLVSGRGRISEAIVTRSQRCTVFRDFLRTVSELPDARLFNACFPAKEDKRCFERLVNRLNRTMEEWDSRAILFCDRGKESVYTRLVRRMAEFLIRYQVGMVSGVGQERGFAIFL